ncbi:MAG: hypothetical protein C4K47_03685 [Candidatus Thorarchaeota archaeon]|nr:MAG: hypothetical protein C4K47_03685 [Candidatus Thorarchaeota archaeon]
MVASPITTYLYVISLILVYGSLGIAFAVGASMTIFVIDGVLCILSLALLQGLRCAITGKTVTVAPGPMAVTRYQQQSDGVHAVTESRWSAGGTYGARYYGLLFGCLGLLFGLMIGFGGEMYEQDTFPAVTLLASTIFAIIGAIAYKPTSS